MRNYLEFEKEIKSLEEKVDNLIELKIGPALETLNQIAY